VPSARIEASASCSAKAKSTVGCIGVIERCAAALHGLLELGVGGEALGRAQERLVQLAQLLGGHGRVHPAGGAARRRVWHRLDDGVFGLRLSSTAWSSSMVCWVRLSAWAGSMTPRSASEAAYRARTLGCCSMA
jgi:hypothetical protein